MTKTSSQIADEIATSELDRMTNGERVTKSSINKRIPLGVDIAHGDIMSRLHKRAAIVSYAHPCKEHNGYWYMKKHHIQEYLKSPQKHESTKNHLKRETSYNRDVSCLKAIIKRHGPGFIKAYIN